MPTFSDKELLKLQIIGGIAMTISFLMGVIGAFFLKHNIGAEEYDTCLRNSGWTLLMVAVLWTALASWHRHLRG
jgi:uncharacterized membrane protein